MLSSHTSACLKVLVLIGWNEEPNTRSSDWTNQLQMSTSNAHDTRHDARRNDRDVLSNLSSLAMIKPDVLRGLKNKCTKVEILECNNVNIQGTILLHCRKTLTNKTGLSQIKSNITSNENDLRAFLSLVTYSPFYFLWNYRHETYCSRFYYEGRGRKSFALVFVNFSTDSSTTVAQRSLNITQLQQVSSCQNRKCCSVQRV